MNDDLVQLGVIKDFNEVCRLCLSQGGVLSRIFDNANASEIEEDKLSSKIEKCVSLQIAENDGLPNLICEHCVLNVDRSLQFKERCIKSDSLLRSYLHSIVQKEKEQSPSFIIKTEIKSEPEDLEMDELHDSIDEDDGEINQEIKEEQSEEVVMIVDPFSIHLDQYDDSLSEDNQDASYQMGSSWGVDEDEMRQSQEDHRRHFNCNICNIGFKGREQLDRHKQIHTAGPPYPCDYCDESFDGRSDLKTHWETHKGDNPFMCDVCGASYAEETTLQMHSVIHERVRPYNCPTCNKSFYYRSDLRKHAIIHTELNIPTESGNELSVLTPDPNANIRKRLSNPEEWKRNQLKKARNEGKAYIDRNMKLHAAKKCHDFIHTCRYQCNQNVPEDVRRQIFKEFWSLGQWNVQTAYLNELVTLDSIQRRRSAGHFSKDVTCRYYLNSHRVCKEFFRKTLDISSKRIACLVQKKKKSTNGSPPRDNRGRGRPANKIPESKIDLIKEHIRLFPTFTSQYSRKSNPLLKYLSQDLNVTKMYSFYSEFCAEHRAEPVTETFYRHIFNSQFNLHLQRPPATCATCDKLELDIIYGNDSEKQQAKELKEIHLQEIEIAKLGKEIVARMTNAYHVVICFDLQKMLPTPFLACSSPYYARQLWTYNLCVHNLQSDEATMYMWHEGQAKGGPEQVASCLNKFIQDLPPYVTHITAFCNSTSQNKNSLIVKFWLYVIQNTQIKSVDYKFLPFEHMTNECHEDFEIVEKYRRKRPTEIYTPIQWLDVIADSNRKFTAIKMTNTDLVSLDVLEPYFKDSVPGMESIECFYLQKGSSVLFYRTSLSQNEFRTFDMKLEESGEIPEKLPPLQAPTTQHKIKYSKYKSLLSLLPYLPPSCHEFYQQLPHDGNEVSQDSSCIIISRKPKTNGICFLYDSDDENDT